MLCLSERHKEPLVVEVFQRPVENGSSSCSTSDHSRSITGFSLSASAEENSSNCWCEKVFPVWFVICLLDINDEFGLLQFCQKVITNLLQASQSVPGVRDRMLVMQRALPPPRC